MRVLIGILLIFAAIVFLLFSLIPALTDDNQFVLDIFEPIYCGSGETLTAVREVGPAADGGVGFTAYYTCTSANGSAYDATGKSWLIMGGGFTVLLLLGIGFLIASGRAKRQEVERYVYGASQFAQAGRQTSVNMGGNPTGGAYSYDSSTGVPATAPDDIFNLPVDEPPATAPDDLFNLTIDNKATMMSIPKPSSAPLDDAPLTMISRPSASTPAAPASPTPQVDLQEKLRQLEEAYDHHLINREEYERKRDEILREF